jgi:hypothetical protein
VELEALQRYKEAMAAIVNFQVLFLLEVAVVAAPPQPVPAMVFREVQAAASAEEPRALVVQEHPIRAIPVEPG